MKRLSIQSELIASVGYQSETAILEIELTNGKVYRYYAVPAAVHKALVGAASPGTYFNQQIRAHFPESGPLEETR
jgi:KTSC domain